LYYTASGIITLCRWLIAKIILRCTVSKTSKKVPQKGTQIDLH